MKLWECFVCGSADLCPHREPELVEWALRKLADIKPGGADLAKIPPQRETGRAARAHA